MNPELKPCAHCGGDARIRYYGAHGALWDARTALKVLRRTLGFNR